MTKLWHVYLHDEPLPSNKKEWTSDAHSNWGKSPNRNGKQKTNNNKTQNSAYYMIPIIWNSRKGKTAGTKRDLSLPGIGTGRGIDWKGAFCVIEMFYHDGDGGICVKTHLHTKIAVFYCV